MKISEILIETKQRLDPKCWKGKHKEGTKIKGGVRVNNCVPNESIEQGVAEVYTPSPAKPFRNPPGFNKQGTGVGNKLAQQTRAELAKKKEQGVAEGEGDPEGVPHLTKELLSHIVQQVGGEGAHAIVKSLEWGDGAAKELLHLIVRDLKQDIRTVPEGLNLNHLFDIVEDMVESLADTHGVDSEVIWEDFESVDDFELLDESAAWHRKAGKSKTGGLNKKGVASYRREHPGSKLQTAVTTKPSKLKKGSKASKRRKSFCARMGGVKGPMKKPNGKPTRKALALRKWNC